MNKQLTTQPKNAFQQLMDRLSQLYSEQVAANRPIHAYVFTLTADDEFALADVDSELPPGLRERVLIEGPRQVFQRIYGVNVEWGATETGVRVRAADELDYVSLKH